MATSRCFSLLLFICIINSINLSTTEAKEWMNPSPLEFFVPQNLQTGDEIVADRPLVINDDADEFVAVSLSPTSDAVSFAPAVVPPGGVFRLILKDRDALLKDFVIQCLGVYSGNLQEIPLHLILDKEDGNSTMGFEKEAYDLKLATPLLEKEIALIKMTSVVPSWARFTLTGPLSEHFSAFSEGGVVVVSSIPCTDCLIDIPSQFSLLLSTTAQPRRSTILNFGVENIQRLRFEYSYEAEIEEGAHTFKKVVKLKATGGKATYSLEDPSGLFSVHPKTGMLTVQHPEFLFLDTVGSSLTLTATATSGNQKAHTTVAIRITPKTTLSGFRFEQEEYKFTVPAGRREGGQLVLSNKPNGEVVYRLAEGPQDLVDFSNGSLTYIGTFPKEDQRYLLLVLAESKEASAAAVTKVDLTITGIGSNVIQLVSPKFSTKTISAENSKGVPLATIEVRDEDENCIISYSVLKLEVRDFDGRVTDLSKEFLDIQKDGKKSTVAFKDDIGSADIVSLETTIEARDAAHPLEPPVTTNLEVFITRNEPIKKKSLPLAFIKTPPMVVIPSTLPIGSFVYQLRSNNQSPVAFTMPQSPDFTLNSTTGVIMTSRRLFGGSRQLLNVTTRTEEDFVEEKLAIEVAGPSDLAPQLSPKEITSSVAVTAPVGTSFGNVTIMNNVEAEFSLEGGEFFGVDSQGVISITSALPLNVDSYILLVRARNTHGYSDCQVKLKVDLDASKILRFSRESYNISVMQNILLNSYVTDLRVVEQGALPVKYSITAPEGEEQLLDIDDEGRVTVREELDTVTGPRTFRVGASDGKRTATASLLLNIIPAFNCVPKFRDDGNDLFYATENEAPGQKVGKVEAMKLDPKCEMRFFFWDGDSSSQETDFARIDAETGEISTKQSFDYENVSSYSMVLGIRAGQRQTAQHASLLLVKDADDHPIRFTHGSITIEVSEASRVGSLLTTVNAEDGDDSQQVYYKLRDSSEEFTVEAETGKIRLAKSLDRETEDFYKIEIGASNSKDALEEDIVSWSAVKIIVRDVNDNGPVFDHGHYEATVEKEAMPGRHVAKVHAVDPDISESGSPPAVFYSLEDSQFEYRGTTRPMNGFFSVDQKTGDVMLLEPVSDFVGGVFHLLIQGSDGLETSSRKGKTGLRVLIHDEGDVIRAEIARNPEFVELQDIQNLTQSITNATGLRALVKDVGYHSAEGVVLREVTDIKMILFNKTTFEITSADRAMGMIKTGLKKKGPTPRIAKAQLPVVVQEASMWPSPVLLIVFVFLLLFLLASLLFTMLICHYRARYRKEKHTFEDHRIIHDALEGPRHRLPPPPPIPRPPTEREDLRLGYDSQVRRMSVGPEEPRTRN